MENTVSHAIALAKSSSHGMVTRHRKSDVRYSAVIRFYVIICPGGGATVFQACFFGADITIHCD